MGDSKKVLLVGWDAADWKVIDPLMAAGHLPTIQRLVEGGVRGNLMTLFPALSPMLWTSIATGMRPFKHGIYGFHEPTPDGRGVQPMSNASRRVKAIWNILNQEGYQSNVVCWWPSHPAEPINGVMVSDFYHKVPKTPDGEWGLMKKSIHPERCFQELAELRIHPFELTPEHVLAFVPEAQRVDQTTDPRLSSLMRVFCEATSTHSAATHLMETEPWDFMAVYYDAIDHFSHLFMKYHPPKQDHVSQEDFEIYQHCVQAGYMYHDMMLARLMELAGEDTTVILMSDHGFHPDHLRPKVMPTEPAGPATEHRDLGIFVINGPGIAKGTQVHGASLLDVAPTVLTLFDLPVGEDMDGHVLTDVFESEREIKVIPSWEEVDGDDGQHGADFSMSPEEAKEALEQLIALGYIDRPDQNIDKAIAECQRELDYNLARAYMDAGMYGEAIPLLESLYCKYPVEFRFGIQLANCLNAMNRIDDLERVIEDLNTRWRTAQKKATERLAEVARAAKTRREQWHRLKEIDEANAKTNPDAPKLARTGREGKAVLFNEAEQSKIRKLRAVRQGNPQTLDFLAASVAMARGDHAKAIEMLEEAKLTQSESAQFLYHIGNAHLELDQLDEAEETFNRGLANDPLDSNCHIGLCRSALGRKDYAKALTHASQAVDIRFQFAPAHYFMGQAKEGLGDLEDAIACYEQALELNPNFPEAHDRLANLKLTVHSDADASKTHVETARDLRWQIEHPSDDIKPIQLPDADPEAILAALPEIHAEEIENTEVFMRCLAQAPDDSEKSESVNAVVVSGLPRSGTSMMMQMIKAAGIEPYTDGERIADESNPKGYYEADLVKGLRNRNDWLAECDGKVVKVISALLPYLPQAFNYKVVFMERDYEEILESQDRMLERLDRPGADLEKNRMAEILDQQNMFAANIAQLHNIPMLPVSYSDAVSDPKSVAQKVAEFLGGDLDVEAMAAAIDPSLYRERGGVKV